MAESARKKPAEKDEAGESFPIELSLPEPNALNLEYNFTDRAERMYEMGHHHLSRGRFQQAVEQFQRATRYDRAHYRAYAGLAETLVIMGRLDEAKECLQKAAERYGRNCMLGAALGHVFLHCNAFESALECVDIAAHNDPDNSYAWLVSGEARLATRMSRPFAMLCFDRCRDCPQPWPRAELRIALAFLEWGPVEEALHMLQRITRKHINWAFGFILLGDAEKVLGHRKESREAYSQALLICPDLEEVRRALEWRASLSRTLQDMKRNISRVMKNAIKPSINLED